MKQKLLLLIAACCLFGNTYTHGQTATHVSRKNHWKYIPLPQVDSVEWAVITRDG